MPWSVTRSKSRADQGGGAIELDFLMNVSSP
jgi:hypothetical protein